MKIQHSELNGKSAFALCRELLVSGHPKDEVLEVWRGDTLAYTISSLKWGAEHRVLENRKEGPKIVKFRKMSEKDKERLKHGI